MDVGMAVVMDASADSGGSSWLAPPQPTKKTVTKMSKAKHVALRPINLPSRKGIASILFNSNVMLDLKQPNFGNPPGIVPMHIPHTQVHMNRFSRFLMGNTLQFGACGQH